MKRGMIEVCVLSALIEEDSYGYKIVKSLTDEGISITESTLYPILKRLEKNECLTVYSVEHNSRLRKFYRITSRGIEQIEEFLNQWDEVKNVYNYIERSYSNANK